jgi:hypothetical protein
VIELEMVRRMIRRAVVVGPIVVGILALAGAIDGGGSQAFEWALSAAVGLAMTLGNLWLSAYLIGGVAERSPQLLLPVGLATFALGLILLTGIAFLLQRVDVISFPITGFVLIVSHLGLVLWDAAGAYGSSDTTANQSPGANAEIRS